VCIRQNGLLKPKPVAYFTLSCELCMTTKKRSVSVIGNMKVMSHVTIIFGVLPLTKINTAITNSPVCQRVCQGMFNLSSERQERRSSNTQTYNWAYLLRIFREHKI
jgi:hypothetical protein